MTKESSKTAHSATPILSTTTAAPPSAQQPKSMECARTGPTHPLTGEPMYFIMELQNYSYVTAYAHKLGEFKSGVHRDTDKAFHHSRSCLNRDADKYDLVDRTPYLGG